MGKKGGSSSTTTTYKPSKEESRLMGDAADYAEYVMPNAKTLNNKAANVLYNSLGDSQVDYSSLLNNANNHVNSATSGLSSLANGELPTAYQENMENSIKSGVNNSMGSLLSDMGDKGIINSSVMNTGLKGISDSASNTMAQNYSNNISNLSNIYDSLINSSGTNISNASASQEAAQEPALNLWNASLGLGGATNSALSGVSGKGKTTNTQSNSGSGLWGGLLSGAASYFCFAPETKIKMADGTEKQIKDVVEKEKVICPHTDGTETEETVLQVLNPTYNDCWNIICRDGNELHIVSATLTQPLLMEDGTFKEISNITLGSNIKGRGKVVNMVYSGERKVHDLQVSGDNNYYADGFIAKGGGTDNWVEEKTTSDTTTDTAKTDTTPTDAKADTEVKNG